MESRGSLEKDFSMIFHAVLLVMILSLSPLTAMLHSSALLPTKVPRHAATFRAPILPKRRRPGTTCRLSKSNDLPQPPLRFQHLLENINDKRVFTPLPESAEMLEPCFIDTIVTLLAQNRQQTVFKFQNTLRTLLKDVSLLKFVPRYLLLDGKLQSIFVERADNDDSQPELMVAASKALSAQVVNDMPVDVSDIYAMLTPHYQLFHTLGWEDFPEYKDTLVQVEQEARTLWESASTLQREIHDEIFTDFEYFGGALKYLDRLNKLVYPFALDVGEDGEVMDVWSLFYRAREHIYWNNVRPLASVPLISRLTYYIYNARLYVDEPFPEDVLDMLGEYVKLARENSLEEKAYTKFLKMVISIHSKYAELVQSTEEFSLSKSSCQKTAWKSIETAYKALKRMIYSRVSIDLQKIQLQYNRYMSRQKLCVIDSMTPLITRRDFMRLLKLRGLKHFESDVLIKEASSFGIKLPKKPNLFQVANNFPSLLQKHIQS